MRLGIAAGGGGPQDPGMEARVAALETDVKDVKSTLQRIDLSLAGITATLAGVATKADVATLGGRIDTLGGKVDALGGRMDKVERAIDDTVKSAVGKAIGPVQLPLVIAACGAVFVGLVAALSWLAHQPWFAH